MLHDLLRMQRARYRFSNAGAMVCPPNVTSIAPATGTVAGGTSVTIRGTHLSAVTAVTLGGAPASITSGDDSTIVCITPGGAPGVVDVVVFTRAGVATSVGGFTYTGAAPTFTSVANLIGAAVGDIDGGYTVTIVGANFVVGATTVTFGGVAATSVVVADPTSLTCTVPAHASGQVNIVITTAGGSGTGVNAWEYWTITQIPGLSELWMADFPNAGPPWVATVGTDLANGAGPPTRGAAQNGKYPCHFVSASAQFLTNPTDTTGGAAVWSLGAGSIGCLFKAASTDAETGTVYVDAAFLANTNADTLMTLTNSGARMIMYDGAFKSATQAFATGAYHLAIGGWDSSNVGIAVDGAAETTAAAGASAIMTGTLLVGRGYGGAHHVDGDMLLLFAGTSKVSAGNRAKIRSYCATRFAVSV